MLLARARYCLYKFAVNNCSVNKKTCKFLKIKQKPFGIFNHKNLICFNHDKLGTTDYGNVPKNFFSKNLVVFIYISKARHCYICLDLPIIPTKLLA